VFVFYTPLVVAATSTAASAGELCQ